MNLYVSTDRGDAPETKSLDFVVALSDSRSVYANTDDADLKVETEQGNQVYIFGDVFYHLNEAGDIKLIDRDSEGYLRELFSRNDLEDIISTLEGQYIGLMVDRSNGSVQIFGDRYARVDSFYALEGAELYLATDLEFIFAHTRPRYDQKMLAQLFSVYGWYTPKGLTIYENVKQLRVGQILNVTQSGVDSREIAFKPLAIEEYADRELETYYKILRESVVARANRDGKTWVSSSSGWDSSMLLGLLVNEFGPENVGMISGSMKYSRNTDVINQFEIDKIKKIGAYYGIEPNLVTLDFESERTPDYWKKVLPYYKSKHMYAFVSYSFARLSDSLRELVGEGQVILNGETSDSLHNFGFSQFVTFFHTKKSFTEFADKMNCYLFGPSFFKKVLDGSYGKDKVWQIFEKMFAGVEFAGPFETKEAAIQSYLFPLFYGGPRIPFAETGNNPVLTPKGRQETYSFLFTEYMPEILSSFSAENLYSWYIYLYMSLHSQGSTVNIHKHAMEANDHGWRMPFNDIRMIEFMSKAPENWGRGLEFNHTKYPLKWVAKNKIKFPYALLDEGPHSYLYDVMEGFSLGAEVVYRSGVTGFFKECLKDKAYRELLSDEYFDIDYLDKLADNYLNGKEATGADFNNLISLITLSATGWY